MGNHTGPGFVRDFASVTTMEESPTIVRVNTGVVEKWPERDDFFKWFDYWRDKGQFKNDFEVAKLAKLNHSSISAWRGGRQRPNAFSLSAVARVFNRPAREAWAHAGLLTDADLAEMGVATPSEQDEHIRAIRESSLSKDKQDLLIAMYQDDLQRAIARSRQQLELLGEE